MSTEQKKIKKNKKSIDIKDLVYDKDADKLTFNLYNVETSFVNAIRRVLLENLPSYALSNIEIKNRTGYIDEFITKRVEMIPLNIEKLENMDQNKIKDIKFNLKVEGKFNVKEYVSSKNLISSDGEQYFSDNHIICTVRGMNVNPEEINQEEISKFLETIELKCDITEGTGVEHAKYQIVTVAAYEIISDENEINNNESEFENTSSLPIHKFLVEGNKSKDLKLCVVDAIEILINKINQFKENLINGNDQIIIKSKEGYNTVYKINNENHTLGNLLTRSPYVINNKDIQFIAYNKPFPYDEIILIKINSEDPDKILLDSCDNCIEIFNTLLSKF